MDPKSSKLIRRIWRHSEIDGKVWTPHISSIATKSARFHENSPLSSLNPDLPELRSNVDWYFTPAVSTGGDRKKDSYGAQKVLWADCDDGYDVVALKKLSPSFMWETSPGHCQAVWLMDEYISPDEFSSSGLMGLLVDVLNADKSGVDVGQLLRIPGTNHHKKGTHRGRILSSSGHTVSRGGLLRQIARLLGFSPQVAAEIGAEDPWGDRSKQLWKIERSAVELGISKELATKLITACSWNKWAGNPAALSSELDKAYSLGSSTYTAAAVDSAPQEDAEDSSVELSIVPWGMAYVQEFGNVLQRPVSWVLPGIIPTSGCGLLVSAPKVGKTRVAIEMMLGCATGISPLGISIPAKVPVGFFSLEDGEYLLSMRMNNSLNTDEGRQQYHWSGHITKDYTWLPSKPMPLLTSFEQIDLSDGIDKQRLLLTIQEYDLKLVIIDTLSMAIGKSDVSNSKDMYSILKDIKTIAKATECAILFIHHTRKRVFNNGETIQEKVLGSTALHAWSDFIISLDRDEESGLLQLFIQTKMGNSSFMLSEDLKKIGQ